MNEEPVKDTAKTLRRISYTLLAAILLLPIAGAFIDQPGAGRYGQLIGQGLGILGLVAVASWLITRKMNPITQDSVRLALTGAVFIWVAAETFGVWYGGHQLRLAVQNVASQASLPPSSNLTESPSRPPSQQPSATLLDSRAEVAEFINKVVALNKLQAEEMEKLDAKLSAVPLDTVLATETVTSKERILQARSKLHHYISLVKERQNLVLKNYAESEKLLNSIADPMEREKAFESFNANKTRQFPLLQKLNEAQFAVANTSLEMLAFFESILGKTIVKDGQPLFQNQTHFDTFNGLLNQLNMDTQREEETTKALGEARAAHRKSVQSDLKKLNR